MENETAATVSERFALRTSGRRCFYSVLSPRFYRSAVIPFNNQLRFFHNLWALAGC
jgi:hypothetical protein